MKDGLVAKWIKANVEADLQQSVIDNWDIAKSPKS